MEVRVQQGNIAEAQVDAIIVNLFEGVTRPGGATGAVDEQIGGLISKVIAAGEFKGELNETTVIHVGDGVPYRKVVVVGLGKKEDFNAERVRQVSASAVKAAAKGSVKKDRDHRAWRRHRRARRGTSGPVRCGRCRLGAISL